MGGGLMELVAKGIQDIFIIGNPQISFFKAIYKRHTNFSVESIQQTIKGQIDFGRRVEVDISKSGDLLSKLILEIDIPLIEAVGESPISWVNSLGHAVIEYYEIEIGGQRIDKHYGEWLEIWSELTLDASKQVGYGNMISKYDTFTTVTGPLTLYVPLQFWFCRDIGLSLPLIALQYHDVKIIIKFRDFKKLWTFGPNNYYTASQTGTIVSVTEGPEFTSVDIGKKLYWSSEDTDIITGLVDDNPNQAIVTNSTTRASIPVYAKYNDIPKQTYSISSARLYADYIYLDSYERKTFAQMKHEYLIEQIQYNEEVKYLGGAKSSNIDLLQFNLPTKSIFWVSQLEKVFESNDLFNYSNTVDPLIIKSDPIDTISLTFNGVERFDTRKAGYFRLVQPYQKFTGIPKSHIYSYTFGFKPEQHQPTGTANFSKIDNKNLRILYEDGITDSTIRIYSSVYNVLRIVSGMAGLAFQD